MIGEIMYAIQQEVLASFNGQPVTVIEREDFSSDNWPSYAMPLITIEEEPGTEFSEMLGGRTRADYSVKLSAYNYRPDISGYDPTDYSAKRMNVADDLRRHFATYTQFLSQEMTDAKAIYGIKWTLSDVGKAESLEHPDGLCKGYAFTFGTISWDVETDGTVEIVPLNKITEINPPPAH